MNYEKTILVSLNLSSSGQSIKPSYPKIPLNLSSSWQSIRPIYLPNIHHHNIYALEIGLGACYISAM